MNKNYYLPATVCALAVCLALGFAAAAWVEPNGIPPADNVVAPINTGGEAQYKTGGLGVKIGGAVTYWISQIGDKLAFKTGNDFATAVETVNINTDGRIGNVAAPIDDKDAVNKAYLDARLSGGTGGGGNIKTFITGRFSKIFRHPVPVTAIFPLIVRQPAVRELKRLPPAARQNCLLCGMPGLPLMVRPIGAKSELWLMARKRERWHLRQRVIIIWGGVMPGTQIIPESALIQWVETRWFPWGREAIR